MNERKGAMRLRVVVAFGGESVEHEISIISAQQVMKAMDATRYEVIPLYISKSAQFYYDQSLVDMEIFKDLDSLKKRAREVRFSKRQGLFSLVGIKSRLLTFEIPFDIVLPILHGTHGEDGTFQGFLRMQKIPYVGCSTLGGAIGQDKIIMKQILAESGIPITPWFFHTYEKGIDDEAIYRKALRLGYPLVVKPANLGSSIGIHVVHDEGALRAAMKEAFQYDHRIVIEKAIENLREINCAVLGDETHRVASVLEEVVKRDEILSYEDKYIGANKTKGMANTQRSIPANIEDDLRIEMSTLAKETFQALCASGVSRIDFLMNDLSKDLYVNEINTIPGSLAFYLWEKSGISFSELIDKLIKIGIHQYQKEQDMTYVYESNILQLPQGCGIKK